jgi:hypothetical protein
MEITLIFNDGKRKSHSILGDRLPDFIEVPIVSRSLYAERIGLRRLEKCEDRDENGRVIFREAISII